MSDEVINLLNKLFELKTQRDYLMVDKQDKIKGIIPEEIRQSINDINLEYSTQESALEDKIDVITESIITLVKQLRTSVKSEHLQAVYNKPRVTWDSNKLEGYAIGHPELYELRRIGESSVSIR